MPEIIQLYRSVLNIEKSKYSAETRGKLGLWTHVDSDAGIAEGSKLILPTVYEKYRNSSLLIIQDSEFQESEIKQDTIEDSGRIRGFSNVKHPCLFGIFVFVKTDEGSYEIFVKEDSEVLFPRRESHKFATLKIGGCVRFKINWMYNFSFSGRRQKTFCEHDYIIQHLGVLEEVQFNDNAKIRKVIPKEVCKLVDERRLLK